MSRSPRGRRVVPIVAFVIVAASVFVFRQPLLHWFGIESGGAPTAESSAHQHQPLPATALAAARAAMDAYEEIRAQLAADRVDGIETAADALSVALRSAATASGDPSATLRQAIAAADHLAHQREIVAARLAFADLSYTLIALAVANPKLQEGWHVFRCPMTPGFGKWFQRTPAIDNPYMGAAMLRCGSTSTWEVSADDAPATLGVAEAAHAGDEPAFYTCPMHPSVRQTSPGACPICGMDLVAVSHEEQRSGVVLVDEVRRQQIGVRTAVAQRGPMRQRVRAVGRITYDETRFHDVSLKQSGWIVDLDVDTTGQPVEEGQQLFTLYSPELQAAQQEYLVARRHRQQASGDAPADRTSGLVAAAEQRLRLWDVGAAQIEQLARAGQPLAAIPFFAPVSGFIVEKNVVAGAAVDTGQRLFRIAPLDRVWIEADFFELDLSTLRLGQRASIRLPYAADVEAVATATQILPYLDEATRAVRVRFELANPHLRYKPGMYADVVVEVDLGDRLHVPVEAVIVTGPRHLVFVDLGEGRLRPQQVRVGVRTDDAYEIVQGLDAGQVVVTSGNFLIAAESRLRSAARYWGGDDHGLH